MDILVFKSGKDLGEAEQVADEDSVSCVDCGTRESDQGAYDNGWQMEPPVCPGCLRWMPSDDCNAGCTA